MAHNVITKEASLAIEHKLLVSRVPLAVFVINRGVKACKVDTDRYNLWKEKYKKDYVGTYDATCPAMWIEDDLAEAGIR